MTRGAELLDRLRPGWAARVDPGRLSMLNAYFCVIGQLGPPAPGRDYGSYFDGCPGLLADAARAGLWPAPTEPQPPREAVLQLAHWLLPFARQFGFWGEESHPDDLTEAWRAELARRRAAAPEEK